MRVDVMALDATESADKMIYKRVVVDAKLVERTYVVVTEVVDSLHKSEAFPSLMQSLSDPNHQVAV